MSSGPDTERSSAPHVISPVSPEQTTGEGGMADPPSRLLILQLSPSPFPNMSVLARVYNLYLFICTAVYFRLNGFISLQIVLFIPPIFLIIAEYPPGLFQSQAFFLAPPTH